MSDLDQKTDLQLVYTILCDDVRLEAGNKLSFMGVFQNIMVQQLPASLIKFAVVNHWKGQGTYLSEVRILTPDRQAARLERRRLMEARGPIRTEDDRRAEYPFGGVGAGLFGRNRPIGGVPG